MDTAYVISIITIFVTWILGMFAKKWPSFNNNLIPVQNLAIGIIATLIQWLITKDFQMAIALSGIIAGGTYDIYHNLKKLILNE